MRTKKLLSILLALCMVLGLMSAVAQAYVGNPETAYYWQQLQNLIYLAPEIDAIELGDNISAMSEDGDAALVIDCNRSITIDLMGKTLNRACTSINDNGHVIVVQPGSTLIIEDSVGGGTITGGWATYGGAICNMGTLIINGGTFNGNQATYGGAIWSEGELTITGGTITGNSANQGGGVYCAGGELKLESSGAITISGNTLTGSAKPSNLCLGTGVSPLTAAFRENQSRIGITLADFPETSSAEFAKMASDAPIPEGVFFSDEDDFFVRTKNDGAQAELARYYVFTFDPNGGSGEMSSAREEDNSTTLPECTFTAPGGKVFKAWYVNGAEKQPGETVSISSGYTTDVKALWEDKAISPEFKTQSLVLSGRIGVNFFVDLPAIDGVNYTDSYMTFDITGNGTITARDNYDEGFKDTTGEYYGFTCYVSSIQMADTITATFHYGDGLTAAKTYSVKEYLEAFDAALQTNQNAFDETTIDLVKALADYGHYVQLFLDAAHEDWSVGADYAEMDKHYTDSYALQEVKDAVFQYAIDRVRSEDIEEITYTLSMDSETAIYVYFKPKDGYTGSFSAKVGGVSAAAAKQSDGRWLLKIPGISAHMLGDEYSIVATTESGDSTVRVSAMSYADGLLTADRYKNDAVAQNAAAALYRYFAAADAYKNAHN